MEWFRLVLAVGALAIAAGCSEASDRSGGEDSDSDDAQERVVGSGVFYCDGTQSVLDWAVGFEASTVPVGAVRALDADVYQGASFLGTWQIPFNSEFSDSSQDYWAGSAWEDDIGVDCDDFANMHVEFITDEGDMFEGEHYYL